MDVLIIYHRCFITSCHGKAALKLYIELKTREKLLQEFHSNSTIFSTNQRFLLNNLHKVKIVCCISYLKGIK